MRSSTRIILLLSLMLPSFAATGLPAAHAGLDLGSVIGGIFGHSLRPETVIRRLAERGRLADFVGIQETELYQPHRRTSRQKITQKSGRRRILFLAPQAIRGKQIYTDGSLTFSAGGGAAAPRGGYSDDLGRLVKKGLGTDHVAGRKTYVVEVSPGGRSGGTRRIWVDTERWVPLGWEDRDTAGKLVSKSHYTEIQFDGDIPDATVFPPAAMVEQSRDLPVELSIEEAEKMAGFQALTPGYLPKGYYRHAVMVSSFGKGRRTVQRITLSYTNGLGLLTLVEAPVRAIRNAPKPGKRIWNAPALVWVRDNTHLVLTATPPLARTEMERIAGSLR